MRSRLVLAAASGVLLLAACGPAQVQRAFRTPTCQLSDTLGLMYQAVPTARLIPCIEQFPVGWTYDSSRTEQGLARFWMDSDRAGRHAVEVTLTRTCDTRGAVEVPSDESGTLLFVRSAGEGSRYVSTRFYVFPGGCIAYSLNLPRVAAPVLSTEVSTAIGTFRTAALLAAARRAGVHV